MFYGETMGDNCVPFLMKIAERYGINLLLEYFMDFRKEDYNQFMVDGKIMDYQSYLEEFAIFSSRCYVDSCGDCSA